MVYVDGFNLYYGCLKNTNYIWLDINKLCQLLLPKNNIIKIKYFTAKIKSRPNDPNKHIRQNVYLRALKTIPNFEIIFGHYLVHTVNMRLANPINGNYFADVIKTEEKGSDVNIATHMIHDGHSGLYDIAVLVSNDSDLKLPICLIQNELRLKVGILNPQKNPSRALQNNATFYKQIREAHLANSQFPDNMSDSRGTFNKPPEWN